VLREEFKGLYDRLAAILFEEDPAGINFEDNTDEYEPEVRTTLPRLKDCRSVQDVQAVVHEEFIRWFDAETVGPRERYHKIATRIWAEISALSSQHTV
jgi:hypothetical protein